jgi:hypothetical protein
MKFIYSGPTSGVTLQTDEGTQEVMLHTDAQVDLPEKNAYVNTLIAMKYLTLVADAVNTKSVNANKVVRHSDKEGA